MSASRDSNDFTGDALHKLECAKTLLRANRGMKRDLGTLNVHLEPGKFAAYNPPGLDSPIFVFVQSNGGDQIFAIGTCISDAVDWQGTPGLSEFLLRENAGLLFGRLQAANSSLILEHHLFGSASARQISTVAICLASTAIELTAELKLLGALMVAEEDDA